MALTHVTEHMCALGPGVTVGITATGLQSIASRSLSGKELVRVAGMIDKTIRITPKNNTLAMTFVNREPPDEDDDPKDLPALTAQGHMRGVGRSSCALLPARTKWQSARAHQLPKPGHPLFFLERGVWERGRAHQVPKNGRGKGTHYFFCEWAGGGVRSTESGRQGANALRSPLPPKKW